MCHLKSSFDHSLTIKIGKVIVNLCEENINSKCFTWNLKESQTLKWILNWIQQILHYFNQKWTKMFSYHKVLGEEKKDWIVT